MNASTIKEILGPKKGRHKKSPAGCATDKANLAKKAALGGHPHAPMTALQRLSPGLQKNELSLCTGRLRLIQKAALLALITGPCNSRRPRLRNDPTNAAYSFSRARFPLPMNQPQRASLLRGDQYRAARQAVASGQSTFTSFGHVSTSQARQVRVSASCGRRQRLRPCSRRLSLAARKGLNRAPRGRLNGRRFARPFHVA